MLCAARTIRSNAEKTGGAPRGVRAGADFDAEEMGFLGSPPRSSSSLLSTSGSVSSPRLHLPEEVLPTSSSPLIRSEDRPLPKAAATGSLGAGARGGALDDSAVGDDLGSPESPSWPISRSTGVSSRTACVQAADFSAASTTSSAACNAAIEKASEQPYHRIQPTQRTQTAQNSSKTPTPK